MRYTTKYSKIKLLKERETHGDLRTEIETHNQLLKERETHDELLRNADTPRTSHEMKHAVTKRELVDFLRPAVRIVLVFKGKILYNGRTCLHLFIVIIVLHVLTCILYE